MPTPSFTEAALEGGFPVGYYELCDRFPIKSGVVPSHKSAKQVLASARRAAPVTPLPSEPKCISLVVPSAPAGFEVYFFLQGHSTFEVFFSTPFDGQLETGSFSSLAKQSWDRRQGLSRDPPYPRPEAYTLSDVELIAGALYSLAQLLARISR